MKKRTKMVYTTPWMECMQIEAEGNFAGSIIESTKEEAASAGVHETGFNKDSFEGENITWE